MKEGEGEEKVKRGLKLESGERKREERVRWEKAQFLSCPMLSTVFTLWVGSLVPRPLPDFIAQLWRFSTRLQDKIQEWPEDEASGLAYHTQWVCCHS